MPADTLIAQPRRAPRIPAFTAACAAGGVALHLAALAQLVAASASTAANGHVYTVMWLIAGSVALAAAQYANSRLFLFSAGFWLSVDIVFYILLKSFELISNDDTQGLLAPLVSVYVFMCGYIAARHFCPPLRVLSRVSLPDITPRQWRALYGWALGTVIFFKAFGFIALSLSGAGSTALDASLATQNEGAAYLFRIGALANAAYVVLLVAAYRNRRFVKTSAVLTALLILDAAASAQRSAIVLTVLSNVFLMHVYVRRVKLWELLVLAPPLVFVLAFFGYVRDIEIGSLVVYADALGLFADDAGLVFSLFMARMDMLPQMVQAFAAAEVGQLQLLYGASYLYELLHAIPRPLWPGKPPLTAAYVTDMTAPGAFAAGVNLYCSIMVEGFINFRWPGVALSGALVALVARGYEALLYSSRIHLQALAVSMLSLPMGLVNEGFHSNHVASLLYVGALYFLWLYAAKLLRPRAWRAMTGAA